MELKGIGKDSTGCGLLLFYVALMPVMVMLNAWVRINLWRWFAVPFFHFPSVPFLAMVGFSSLVDTFRYAQGKTSEYEPTTSDRSVAIAANVLGALLCLGIGYVAHILVGR